MHKHPDGRWRIGPQPVRPTTRGSVDNRAPTRRSAKRGSETATPPTHPDADDRHGSRRSVVPMWGVLAESQ
jgi:hypothetical protein